MNSVIVACLAVAIVGTFAFMPSQSKCGMTVCPFGNNNCTDPACSRCNGPSGFNGVCVQGHPCGHACTTPGDCDQLSDCKLCIDKKCSASCSMKCSSSSQCAAPCGTCINGTCQEWKCGNTCTKSGDCAGPCATCAGGKCVSECSALCQKDSDCPFGCGHCNNGKCTSGGKCKSKCVSNLQCLAPTCNQCINNTCAGGCGGKCDADTFCSPFTGCGKCVQGQCAPWKCGNTCSTSSDCAGDCAYCDNTTSTGGSVCRALCGNYCEKSSDCQNSCGSCVDNKCTKSS